MGRPRSATRTRSAHMRNGPACDPLDLYRSELFALCHVGSADEFAEYRGFLQSHYEPLGFFCGEGVPSAPAVMFALPPRGEAAAGKGQRAAKGRGARAVARGGGRAAARRPPPGAPED